MNDGYRCPVCERPMTAYSATGSGFAVDPGMSPRSPGYYAEPCGHRIVVFRDPDGLFFTAAPSDLGDTPGDQP